MAHARGVSARRAGPARVVAAASKSGARALAVETRPKLRSQEYWAQVELPPDALPEWRRNLDLASFGKEINTLKMETMKAQSVEEDVSHLKGVLNFSIALYWAGIGLSVVCNPFQGNILAALCVSTAVNARWTMVGHHTCHGGYNRQQQKGREITGRFHRKTFAQGFFKRFVDWLDWMMPSAWDAEHNDLHHYYLGEDEDPDLVERNLHAMRTGGYGPMPMRYLVTFLLMVSWKWYYYAPNTLKEMHEREKRMAARAGDHTYDNPFKTGKEPTTIVYGVQELFNGARKTIRDKVTPLALQLACMLPYFLTTFAAIPGVAALAFGVGAGKLVLANMVLAELLTNLHSFVVIATNHVGNDIYRFATNVKPNSPEFYLRAIIGSTNFHVGARVDPDGNHRPSGVRGNVVDYLHGFLNYQIEHHMFPEMSMLSYQKIQPKVKAICAKYDIPYVQEPVWTRLKKTVDVMVGREDMLQWERGD